MNELPRWKKIEGATLKSGSYPLVRELAGDLVVVSAKEVKDPATGALDVDLILLNLHTGETASRRYDQVKWLTDRGCLTVAEPL